MFDGIYTIKLGKKAWKILKFGKMEKFGNFFGTMTCERCGGHISTEMEEE
jgi:hypothetical protein